MASASMRRETSCRLPVTLGQIQTYYGTNGAFLHNLVTGLTNPAWFLTSSRG